MEGHIKGLISSLKKKRKNLPFICLGLVVILTLVFADCSIKKEKTLLLLGLRDCSINRNDENIFLGPVASAREYPELSLIGNNSLIGFSSPLLLESHVLATMSQDDIALSREILEYTVREKDSLWSIASDFNISIDTVVWTNNIKSQLIRPGQKLIILPVSGVMHLVKEGDTVSEIAKKYDVEIKDVTNFNDLGDERELFAGEIIIVPDGKMPFNSSVRIASSAFTGLSTNNFYGQSHAFPYGQCTWWVAQRRAILSWGNAVDWLPNATASGYPTCSGRFCTPGVGAVISLKGHRIYGHVAYVERVSGNQVIFSEMNYIGLGTMTRRSLRVDSSLIKGYIY